ncbi:ATP-dependent helicase [Cryobacterium sp. TMT1-62]|uniref:DISARM system SNF2-like helicase DrmD n=1 Tax=Cryobacterium sp. TMT1-62 TaxID=1259240 RepID=UPI00106D48D9|nr:DISARM system SNF2-like helicase DrmD [Cryobacterium sp. TMT1-62]TFD32132.1 ATP-dependent helicase [Cryobacterium sp. TMT1-62]
MGESVTIELDARSTTTTTEVPEVGRLASVRGAKWIVTNVAQQALRRSSADDGTAELQHAVSLQSIEEEHYGRELTVVWELEPGRGVILEQGLPVTIDPTRIDDPTTFAAYVDALRWGALTSADARTLQAPFRSSATVEAYQLEPLRRALEAPRANLLLADDVGLGKTVEAGLVVQELLLRHRARSVIIVCPAGLVIKWKEEMSEKFGLTFEIVNSNTMRDFRRRFGVHANPFVVFPRVIVSMSWLPTPRAERLLRDVYARADDKRIADRYAFDVVIIDEAHHVAPAAPSRGGSDTNRYAVDSQRTVAVRELARRCEHRLFLSATPHNGYTESFTALMEMVDPQRFARGADLDPQALAQVAVRRLKKDLPNEGFQLREVHAMLFQPSAGESEAYDRLIAFTTRRNKAVKADKGKRAADLATLILKKRFFSSPTAFAATAETYLATRLRGDDDVDLPDYDEVLGDEASDEEEGRTEQPELEALRSAQRAQVPLTDEDVTDLEWLIDWGSRFMSLPDTKLQALINQIRAQLLTPDGTWLNGRLVIFTEYVATLHWIRDVLNAFDLGGDRLAVIEGATDADERELIRVRFTEEPSKDPVRILLATDAAGEGIDLQTHCHRLVSYDIPFNPNRLEQRIGRIDRYGQTERPQVYHPDPEDKSDTASNYARDTDYLARVARKISRVQEDLGSAGDIIDPDIQRDLGYGNLPSRPKPVKGSGEQIITKALQGEQNLGRELTELADRLEGSRDRLHLHDRNLRRVLETGLRVSGQPGLIEVVDDQEQAELFALPSGLDRTWTPGLEGLHTRLHPEVARPITFEGKDAKGRTDIVYAHLGHPLIQRAARELRGQIWTRSNHIHGVSAVVVDGLEQSFVAGVARLVVVGDGGTRLHEEVFLAGTRLRRRQEIGVESAEELLVTALDADRLAVPKPGILVALADLWNEDGEADGGIRQRVRAAVDSRAQRLRGAIEQDLDKRKIADLARVDEVFARFRHTLASTLDNAEVRRREVEQMLFHEEQQQREKDLANIRRRLDVLTEEQRDERNAVARRYANLQPHTFVAAVVFALSPADAERLGKTRGN